MKWPAAVALLLASLTACGSSSEDAAGDRTLTVFAAASLKDSFSEIAEQFEAENPGVTVRLSFAGSADLVAQVEQGAPADVLATADERTMRGAQDDGLVEVLDSIGSNRLEIATPPGNPAGIRSLADLAGRDVQVVLCAPAVPCGAAAHRVEKIASIDIEPVSEEQSVTDVLSKVAAGEADAGLVYVTDVQTAGDSVDGVPFAESAEVVSTYPIASLSRSDESALAQSFVDFVATGPGQDVLRAAGFGPR
ncbi:molybdate ABC transporter substrate-binding protein [Aeromicrobium sp. SMF47]|uniref:Molybdate ABC transporter substrate-binding protein n=1 Tax=Aeromicrobium yanjiei TaxID=2662028 RepID=A0A5Q2MPZ1_9ACTN|nr:molybdate ABC transporter substrate-binding protein [Aeromicrobium yanjiei]MRJ76585.1 molybdate ABC transporter substrate-binding protein [Aeromicrobium yanjiei]QGG42260.1 molybdate ABC transporter substrate-binding protein [Aeromicrobium yanjiei]